MLYLCSRFSRKGELGIILKIFIKKMATKIRLQRHGRKGYAYYHIVVADVRAPRDGKFIERLGSYNPNTNPATIDLNFDRSLYWVQVGAQPTDTVRNILSDEGVMLKKHLLGGVRKGAFDEAAADKKFEAWKAEKENKISKSVEKLLTEKDSARKTRLEAEKEKNKAKAAEVAKKKALLAAELAGATAPEEEEVPAVEEVAEEAVEQAMEETPAVEEAAPAVEEAPVAEPAAEETPAE